VATTQHGPERGIGVVTNAVLSIVSSIIGGVGGT
jgi:hypothetical protein